MIKVILGSVLSRVVAASPFWSTLLAEKGWANTEQLRQLNLSNQDLREGLHENGNPAELAQLEAVYLEHNGSLSVVKKRP